MLKGTQTTAAARSSTGRTVYLWVFRSVFHVRLIVLSKIAMLWRPTNTCATTSLTASIKTTKGIANAACTLATLGADSHVIDTAQICQLRISDALKQELVASELNRCGIEDSDVCGAQGLPTVLADLTPESAVCYAGTTYRKEKGGSWNFLDSAQIVAGNYDVSVSLNIFSYNWGWGAGPPGHTFVRASG